MHKGLNNRGMTLVEIIVALLVVSIVMAISGGILLASSDLYTHNAAATESKLLGDGIYRQVSRSLSFAADLRILEDSGTPDEALGVYRIDGDSDSPSFGHLMYKPPGQSFYVDSFASAYSPRAARVSLEARAYDEHMLELTVIVFDAQDNEKYRTVSAFEAMNIRLAQHSITDGEGDPLEMSHPHTAPVLGFLP